MFLYPNICLHLTTPQCSDDESSLNIMENMLLNRVKIELKDKAYVKCVTRCESNWEQKELTIWIYCHTIFIVTWIKKVIHKKSDPEKHISSHQSRADDKGGVGFHLLQNSTFPKDGHPKGEPAEAQEGVWVLVPCRCESIGERSGAKPPLLLPLQSCSHVAQWQVRCSLLIYKKMQCTLQECKSSFFSAVSQLPLHCIIVVIFTLHNYYYLI